MKKFKVLFTTSQSYAATIQAESKSAVEELLTHCQLVEAQLIEHLENQVTGIVTVEDNEQ